MSSLRIICDVTLTTAHAYSKSGTALLRSQLMRHQNDGLGIQGHRYDLGCNQTLDIGEAS